MLKPCQFTGYQARAKVTQIGEEEPLFLLATRYFPWSETNQLNQDTAMLIAVNLRLKALINKVRSSGFTSSYRLAIGNKPSLLVIPC